jgi:hypothetical protein
MERGWAKELEQRGGRARQLTTVLMHRNKSPCLAPMEMEENGDLADSRKSFLPMKHDSSRRVPFPGNKIDIWRDKEPHGRTTLMLGPY